ncbi:MAG: histidine phosphatase family protein [Spirochaetia bacterium]|nr:histidine phosphatase family protein [Spirochaetia bacterium]
MKKLYLIRHGEVVESTKMLLTGSTDLPLTKSGVREMETMAAQFKLSENALILHSPLLRARQSAEILFKDRKIESLPKLCEIDFGLWENQRLKEITKKNKEMINKWENDFENFAFPEGESVKNFIKRIEELADFFILSKNKEIAAVAHKGVITFLLCRFLGIPYQKYAAFQVSTGSLSILNLFEKYGTLSALNITYEKK